MADPYYEIGRQLRAVLSGFLQGAPAPSPGGNGGGGSSVVQWGPQIQLAGLPDLFHPQEVRAFTAPPGGIDNLHLSSVDKILIPGRGEFTIDFHGMMQIARDHPTTRDWATASVYVNMTDMALRGTHPDLGRITVTRNPKLVSPGQTFGPGIASAPAACRIAAGVQFTASDMGMTLYNREPILLMNDAIESIPPVEDPNGAAHLYRLPLYDQSKPDGKPAAYLTSLRYTIGNYVTQAEASAFRAQVA
jgi:hypothetical protein